MYLNEIDLLVLDKLKELHSKTGKHAEEWVMRNELNGTDKKNINKSLRKLHGFNLITPSPYMCKAWVVNMESNQIEEMKQSMPKNDDNSRPKMTIVLMDRVMRKEEERIGKREFSSSEMVELFSLDFGKPREKDPDRKIRNWWKMGLYDRHGFAPRFTYSVPMRRRKALYFERPLFAYAEE